MDCPCGSGKAFEHCCGPYLQSEQLPETAEALMRSRYTAFVLENEPYLLSTWDASSRPQHIDFTDGRQWLGLKVILAKGGKNDVQGQVEFVARFKINGKAWRHHELSRFVQEDGRWFYVDGNIKE